jgi:hypothetical protein
VITARKIQPDEQSSIPLGVGVGTGAGVAVGRGVEEAAGTGLLVMALVPVTVGSTGSAPVTETKLSRTRACADVVSSPRKRKFGVSYGSGKPSNVV